MFSVLLTIIVILAVFLCFIVTIQNSKGGGLAAGFSSSNQIMGVRKTTDVLEKATWGIATFIMVLCFVCAFMSKSEVKSLRGDQVQTEQTQSSDNSETQE